MEILKKSAHLLSDEMVMVKAIFGERSDGTSLRFMIAAMDRNYASISDNLMSYLNIINDGSLRMKEIYNHLLEEKNDPSIAIKKALTPAVQPESKLIS